MIVSTFFWLLVFGYLIVFFVFAKQFSRREGYLSAFTVFGIMGFYYYLGIPIEIELNGDELLSAGGNTYSCDQVARLNIAGGAFLAILGFALGLSTARLPGGLFLTPGSTNRRPSMPIGLGLFLVLSTILLLLLGGPQLLAGRTYVENSEFFAENSAISQAFAFFRTALAVVGSLFLLRTGASRSIGYLCAAFLCLQGFYFFDKNPILLGVVAMCVTRIGPKYSSTRHLVFLILVFVAIVYSLPLFSLYRTPGASFNLAEFLEGLSLKRTDGRGPMASLVVETTRNWHDFEFGRSYLNSLVGWVPLRVYPGRPLDLSIEFARNQITDYKPGMGMGYSLLAEAYANFGAAGAFLQYFLFGALWPRLWKFVVKLVGNPYLATSLYVVVGLGTLGLIHRGPCHQIVRSFVYNLLPIVILTVLLDRSMLRKATTNSNEVDMNRRISP